MLYLRILVQKPDSIELLSSLMNQGVGPRGAEIFPRLPAEFLEQHVLSLIGEREKNAGHLFPVYCTKDDAAGRSANIGFHTYSDPQVRELPLKASGR